ncbi:MAG TPA: hypothetical protein VGI45_18875 [Terracidiphilus sp.]|jgi:hypothetical protein
MKNRLNVVFLSFGTGLFLYTVIGREIALLARHSFDIAPLWLLAPSFLLIGIASELKADDKTTADLPSLFYMEN